MAAKRYLIVNADDFGQSPGVNRGIITAYEHGIVTSASLMVRWPAAAEAAAYAKKHRQLSVGLHVDLGEWTYREGSWVPTHTVVPVGDRAAVVEEIKRQLAEFHRLLGQAPTHLDSHQHVHRKEPVRSLLLEAARELRIPLRHFSPDVEHRSSFYGHSERNEPSPDGISVEGLMQLLREIPPGITELGCHPGEGSDLDSMYGTERAEEVKTLCDPRIRSVLKAEDIQLCSFLRVFEMCF
jgi:chitin disaccharide deacetylase